MSAARRNNVRTSGAGDRTVVFAHGFGGDQSVWRHLAPDFIQDSRVVLFDHVGAGRSDAAAYDPGKYATLTGYADDLVEICDEQGLSGVTLVGHSVGATIGLLAAVKRPDLVADLVLICPSPRYTNTDTYFGGFDERDIDELLTFLAKDQPEWATAIAPTVVGPEHPEVQAEWRRSVCSLDPKVAAQFARTTFKSDHRADYGRVSARTLIIDCSQDGIAPSAVGAWVEEAIEGSRRITLQAQGHCPHLTLPGSVMTAIGDFIGAPARTANAA
jgi:sigma-B regulation protein RsbQ